MSKENESTGNFKELAELTKTVAELQKELASVKKMQNEEKAQSLTDRYDGKVIIVEQIEAFKETLIVKSPVFETMFGELALSYGAESSRGLEGIVLSIPSLVRSNNTVLIDLSTIQEVEDSLGGIIDYVKNVKEDNDKLVLSGVGLLETYLSTDNTLEEPWAENVEYTEEDNSKAEESFKKAETGLVSDFYGIEKLKANQERVIQACMKIKEIKESLLMVP